MEWNGGHCSVLGCIRFYSIVYCVHPVEWSGGHYSAYPVEWHGGQYSLFGCILFYSIVYCAHPVVWSGGHYSAHPVEWHGGHYSLVFVLYSILNGFIYALQPLSLLCLPSGVERLPS